MAVQLSALGRFVLLYMKWISLCARFARLGRREGRVSMVVMLAVSCISITSAKLK